MTFELDMEDIKKLPAISKERIAEIEKFEDKDISDCSELSDTQIEKLRPFYEKHPEWYKVVVAKTPIQIRIDNDVLEVLKADGHGYQTRINAILRQAVFG